MRITEEQKEKVIAVLIVIVVILLGITTYEIIKDKKEEPISDEISIIEVDEVTTTSSSSKYYVDIKGAVKKPGVYQVSKGSIVNDVIKLAGGLKSNAYTLNINLSQETKNQMVIYIYSKNEIKNLTTTVKNDITCTTNVIEVNNCITTTRATTTSTKENTETTKVNINTATKEELLTLTGIGESKANAIIEYRKENKFNTIEDLKNVSGIGDSMYAKIKDNITV